MAKKQIFERVEYLLIFFVLIYFYCSGLESAIFHPDESQWIGTSAVFEAYFSGDFSSPLWNESYWTITQPPLPRYMIGLGRLMGGLGVAELNSPWIYHDNEQTNIAKGRLPSQRLLWWSRLPMGILAAAAILVGFFLLKRIAGRWPGYLWIMLCLLSSYFPLMLSRAMGESSLLASIAGIMFISDRLLQVSDNQELKKPGKLYIYFLLLGIAIGLAESSKLNGLSVIAAGFALALLIGVRMKQTRTMKILFGLIAVTILTISSQLTFLLLNPYLWKDPLNRTITMFSNRITEMNNQQIAFPASRIQGFSQQVKVVTTRIFQTYSPIHFDGVLWINIIFFLVGLACVLVTAVKYLKHQHSNSASAALLLVGMAASLPSLFTPLDWDRYYLLPVYFSTLAAAVGIWWLGLWVYRRFRKGANDQQVGTLAN